MSIPISNAAARVRLTTKQLSLIVGFAFCAATVHAQTDQGIVLRALPGEDRVVLRWGPTDPAMWVAAKSGGYRIERAAVSAEGELEGNFSPLTAAPLLPWSAPEWESRITPDRMYVAVAAEALHGESFAPEPSAGFIATIRAEATELNFRFGFSLLAADLDSLAAEGLALRYVDEGVEPGRTYMYRAYLAAPGAPADTGYVLVEAVNPPAPRPPYGFGAVAGDERVLLTWDRMTEGEPMTAYELERSQDGGRSWQSVTNSPLVPAADTADVMHHVDSTLVNYRTYRYRLYGITPFARRTSAADLDVMPRDLTPPPAPQFQDARHLQESTVSLSWTAESAPDLTGFRIGIGSDPEGPFDIDLDRLHPPDARSAEDSRAVSHLTNYYVVVAVDTAGNAAPSLPRYVHLVDSLPPAPPVGLALVEADTSGLITITWNAGPEPDLYGYRIFRANQPDHAFTLRTGYPVRDTVFVDTVQVRTLTRDIYYHVSALDRNFNASPISTTLRVRLPDVVPPVAPIFTSVTPTDSSVQLAWIPSSSADVSGHALLRRDAGAVTWQQVAALGPDAQAFEDVDVMQRRSYEYTLVAEDSSGLRSPGAQPVRGRPYDTGVRAEIEDLSAILDEERRTIRLVWDYPAVEGDYWFVVYRGVEDGPLSRYRSTGTKRAFEDVEVRLRHEAAYRYAVQAVFRDGGSSDVSDTVSLEYPR